MLKTRKCDNDAPRQTRRCGRFRPGRHLAYAFFQNESRGVNGRNEKAKSKRGEVENASARATVLRK